MNTPTPNALRAAKRLFPSGNAYIFDEMDPNCGHSESFQTARALEIDEATGLPELVALAESVARFNPAIAEIGHGRITQLWKDACDIIDNQRKGQK